MKFEHADMLALDEFYHEAMNRFTADPRPEALLALSLRDQIGLMIVVMSFLRIVAHGGVEPRAEFAFNSMLDLVSQLGVYAGIEPPSHLPQDASLTEYLLAHLN